MTDPRITSAAARRNRDPILAVLRRVLPPEGLLLEIASGGGEHALHWATHLPGWRVQPTDPSPEALASIAAWAAGADLATLRPPLRLDVREESWPVAQADAVLCVNMIHIAPWAATPALMAGAARCLPPGAPLLLYGPYRRGGAHTAPGNAEFDAGLRARNPDWGVRDLEAVTAEAVRACFRPGPVEAMPANNLMPVFHRL